MKTYHGRSLLDKVAVGKVFVYQKKEYKLEKIAITNTEAEKKRFDDARQQAVKQLEDLYQKALKDVGEEQAQIFDIHKMMLEDVDYIDNAYQIIEEEHVNAEYAVSQTGDTFSQMFAQMDDAYMKERAIDVLDVTKRVMRKLCGVEESIMDASKPVILVAEDLTPSETVSMDTSKILAFVTIKGSANSHTAILARSMNIPALVKTDLSLDELFQGVEAIVDGTTGSFYVEPDQETTEALLLKKMELDEKAEELKQLVGQESVTIDGKKIKLYANIGNVGDVNKVLENDAEGIGLFRSEFLYIGRDTFPTENEQFQAYKAVLEKMEGKKVVIRTLDIGADKKADYFNLDQEENPALGYRAIRICLAQKDIFKTQLRALYRASVYGNLAIMFPMIISVDEVLEIKEVIKEVQGELKEEGIPYGEAELGIMIETPAAAIISDELAKEVSFFSIGSNDLTQYTLAIDRQNEKLDGICNTHHRAIMKLIQMTIENGHKEGIWVGICGELAADTTLTERFVQMGVDELSVSSSRVLKVRKCIRESRKEAER